MVYENKDITRQPCFIEANNVSNSIMKLIQLNIQRDKGVPVDDEIDYEITDLTAHNLRLKKCIIREAKYGI